ncbi:MAG: sensor histidine kinase [Candidatus Cyclobacteriaceae bacterium M2_1C_046]
MAYLIKNFRINIILRVLIIGLLALLLAFIITTTEWLFTPLFILLLLIGFVVNLIFYVEKINNELSQFLYNIKQGGFTSLIKGNKGGKKKLTHVFNEVIHEFKKVSIEKESHYQYLKTLNENIGISIISFKEHGEISLMNPSAKALLKKPFLKNIQQLEDIDPNLYKVLMKMRSGQREVIKSFIAGEMIHLSVQLKKFIVQEEKFNVLLLQNIHHELEQKEVEAWQKLISVLTHEIMNSVTPIASLSTAVNQQLNSVDSVDDLEQEDRADILTSLKTIENRSKGLLKFVNAYKEFAKTPELHLADTDLVALINRICNLLNPDLLRNNIDLVQDYSFKELKVRLDHELIEQVIINLIKNSLEALEGQNNGVIKIQLQKIENYKIQIKIADNGSGMDKETLEKIFIPFFTTKKKGTGVGLSFARQVLKLHGGSITVNSDIGKGTEINLLL